MNHDAIPEFESTHPRRRDGLEIDALGRIVLTTPSGITVFGIPPMPKQHHPTCAECCAIGRCHWCLVRPESGTLTSTGPDGFVYSACRAHLHYFANAQRQANPHAGVDLTDGLRHLEIVSPSPLVR